MPPLRLFLLHRLQRQPVHATGLQGIAQDGVKDSANADLDAGIAKVPEIQKRLKYMTLICVRASGRKRSMNPLRNDCCAFAKHSSTSRAGSSISGWHSARQAPICRRSSSGGVAGLRGKDPGPGVQASPTRARTTQPCTGCDSSMRSTPGSSDSPLNPAAASVACT